MIYDDIIKKLEENAAVFKSLLENIPKDQSYWKPSPGKWSLLEVINHLYDEEREDFRQRIKNVFEDTVHKSDPEKIVDFALEAQFNIDSTFKPGNYKIMYHINDNNSGDSLLALVRFKLEE
jgi:hypothetical protein